MNDILVVLLKTLPIILMLFLGFRMKKKGFISSETIGGMKKIAMNIAVPALIFMVFFKAEMKPEILVLTVVIFAACSVEFALGFLFKRLQRSSNPFYPSLFTTFLTGPIGIPLFIAYFGTENLYRLAILDIGNSLFLFTVLTIFLTTVGCDMNSRGKQSLFMHLNNLFKSPLTVSMLLGMAFSLTGWGTQLEGLLAPAAVLETLSILAGSAVPLTLIIVGYDLPFDFKNFKTIIGAVLLRMAMMLSLAYLINTFIIVRWLQLDELYQAALYTMFILPPPFIIPLSIVGECDHKQYVLDFISLHLLLSLPAFILIMSLL